MYVDTPQSHLGGRTVWKSKLVIHHFSECILQLYRQEREQLQRRVATWRFARTLSSTRSYSCLFAGTRLLRSDSASICVCEEIHPVNPVGFHLEHYSCGQPILLTTASQRPDSVIELNSGRRDDPRGQTFCILLQEDWGDVVWVEGDGGCALSSAVQEMDNVQVLNAEVRSCQFTDAVWLTVRLALLNAGAPGHLHCKSSRGGCSCAVAGGR